MVQRERATRELVALSARPAESATTLLETIVVVGIIVILLASFGTYFLGRKPYALRAAVETVRALVSDARAVAQTSGKGATLALAAEDGGGFRATLYPYRPLPGADLSAAPVRRAGGDVQLTPLPLAIFFSSSATASSTAWTPASGRLASEPLCIDAIVLTFDDGARRETHAVGCADATLR